MDMDKLEEIAKAAEIVHPGPWDGWLYSSTGPVSRSTKPGSFETIVYELPEKESGGEELARYIAAFSPDVVLRLLQVARLSAEYESADAGDMSHEVDAAYLKWRTAVRELTGRL